MSLTPAGLGACAAACVAAARRRPLVVTGVAAGYALACGLAAAALGVACPCEPHLPPPE